MIKFEQKNFKLTILANGLYVSSEALKNIGNPKEVNVGIDESKKKLAIRAAREDGSIKYPVNNYKIFNRTLISKVKNISSKKTFFGKFNARTNLIEFYLGE